MGTLLSRMIGKVGVVAWSEGQQAQYTSIYKYTYFAATDYKTDRGIKVRIFKKERTVCELLYHHSMSLNRSGIDIQASGEFDKNRNLSPF